MSINMDKLIKLNDLVTTSLRRKHIIILNPEEQYENMNDPKANVEYDKVQWKMPANEKFRKFIEELSKNEDLNNEEKILYVYERLCRDYVYDDNLISYLQKNDDDSFALPDWYGRDVGEEWEENREQHNRRVCYEVSRYLAKALEELFKDDENIDVCILWDKGLTHYFVALTCNEYSITLDLDDFNNIKDLTRIKAGLTAEGIRVLEDKKGEFKIELDKFNKGRAKDSADIVNNSNHDSDDITLIKNSIEKLKEMGIDSQGIYEYIKEIVDITLGPEARKKVWKEIKGNKDEETRYIRCLILDIDNQKYIIDVDCMLLREFDEEEFRREDSEFIPYKKLLGDDLRDHRGRPENRYKGR